MATTTTTTATPEGCRSQADAPTVGLISRERAQWLMRTGHVWTGVCVPEPLREWALEVIGSAQDLLLADAEDAEWLPPAELTRAALVAELRRMEAADRKHDLGLDREICDVRDCAQHAGAEV